MDGCVIVVIKTMEDFFGVLMVVGENWNKAVALWVNRVYANLGGGVFDVKNGNYLYARVVGR